MHKHLFPIVLSFTFALLASESFAAPTADANNNGDITRTEYLNFMANKFAETDKNFDGKLTQEELKFSRQHKLEELARGNFRFLDQDKDGILKLENFSEQFETIAVNPRMEESAADQFFELLDKNGNGNVSRSEYIEYVQAQKQLATDQRKEMAANYFKSLDLNQDGYVDEDEFIYKGRNSKATINDTSANPFSNLRNTSSSQNKSVRRDGNSDGIITKSEDREYNLYLFEKFDSNGDGIVYETSHSDFFSDVDNMNMGNTSSLVIRAREKLSNSGP
ncbi:EF-hand domain-containing protein [Litorimonas sp.]|uniref:EF-hand domain-containing protein n=1 Tax=Litorimonas sp. TaxID=1892381 RepID=UPI003A854462